MDGFITNAKVDTMSDESVKVKVCPKCGCDEYLDNYPAAGMCGCAECGLEVTSIALNEISEDYEKKRSAFVCPACGKTCETKEAWFSDGDAYVFKCTDCGKLAGYLLVPFAWDPLAESDDDSLDGEAAVIAKTEGKLVGTPPDSEDEEDFDVCLRKFGRLVDEKSAGLMGLGVALATVDLAVQKARGYLKGVGFVTENRLGFVFSAGFVLAQDELGDLGELKGTYITSRQVADVFGVDRKTTRKWVKILEKSTA